jgi:hypothetical protein
MDDMPAEQFKLKRLPFLKNIPSFSTSEDE